MMKTLAALVAITGLIWMAGCNALQGHDAKTATVAEKAIRQVNSN